MYDSNYYFILKIIDSSKLRMDHEGEEFEEVHFDDDEEEPMDSDGEDMGDDEDRNAQYGDEEEIENG